MKATKSVTLKEFVEHADELLDELGEAETILVQKDGRRFAVSLAGSDRPSEAEVERLRAALDASFGIISPEEAKAWIAEIKANRSQGDNRY